jgi:hypothetical protein
MKIPHRINRCPRCGKSKYVEYIPTPRNPWGSTTGNGRDGSTSGNAEHHFYCSKCPCVFNVHIDFKLTTKEQYFEQYLKGPHGIQG